MNEDLEILFKRLSKSKFRSSFKLKEKELNYLNEKGLSTIMNHGRDFISNRLAPENPKNDGKQTPWGKHPIFVAQHATATCCRGCLSKWHKIPKNTELTSDQIEYVLSVIQYWISKNS